MDNPEFPPNSEVSKKAGRAENEERDIRQVTSGPATRRKKSLGRKFRETFVVGDLKTAIQYAVLDVFLPDARDSMFEFGTAILERLMFGDGRRRRGYPPPSTGPYGRVNYTQYSQMGSNRPWTPLTGPQRAMSRRGRSQHDFDEILLDSRSEAEQVIDQLFDVVSRYDTATVADLYELVGLASSHTDNKWGWTDLRGAGVTRTRDGYLLDLPEPIPL